MIKDPAFDQGSETSSVFPVALDFHVTPKTEQAIKDATAAAFQLVDSQTMSFHLTKYGKAAIKRFQTSPDSWAQMIIQLAYARLLNSLGQNRKGSTYESASTRKFYKGRTEVIRTISSESDAFVQSMLDPHTPWSKRKALFKEAAKKHIETAKAAGSAQGIDRHLLGLKKVMEKDEVGTVALFDDPVYKRSQYWVLSTSAVFSGIFEAYGWGEVVPDGFGVAYMTGFDGTAPIFCLYHLCSYQKRFASQIILCIPSRPGRKCRTRPFVRRLRKLLRICTSYLWSKAPRCDRITLLGVPLSMHPALALVCRKWAFLLEAVIKRVSSP